LDAQTQEILAWIATQHEAMLTRVVQWAGINSYTRNIAGLAHLTKKVAADFSVLGGEIALHDLPPAETIGPGGQNIQIPLGQAIVIDKRPESPTRVLLNIHLDTVYPPDSSFQTVTPDGDRLRGPGVADAKGGIAVMLTALEAVERSPVASRIGWRVLLNPDEEIGSPGSSALLAQSAKHCHFGLLFEPALVDGGLIDRRKGSGNFSIVVRGKAAHAGRAFESGRSAILAAAKISLRLHELNHALPGITLNIGAIDGGGPANVVPDLAICRINIRTTDQSDEQKILSAIDPILAEANAADGIRAKLHGNFASPPKIPDTRTLQLLKSIIDCGRELGLSLPTRASGGASDGNRLAAAGLPNIDTLGVRGDHIHSPDEFMIIPSLVERAQLTALLLVKIAAGEIPAP